MKKLIFVLLTLLIVISGCKGKEYSDIYYDLKDKKGVEEQKNDDEEIVLNVHHYNNNQFNGGESEIISVLTSFIQKKDSKESYFLIRYSRLNQTNVSRDVGITQNLTYDIQYYPDKLIYKRSNMNSSSLPRNQSAFSSDKNEGTINLKKKKYLKDAGNSDVHNIFLLLREYLPKLEKDCKIKLSDYNYVSNFKSLLKKLEAQYKKNQDNHTDQSDEDNQGDTNDSSTNNNNDTYVSDPFEIEKQQTAEDEKLDQEKEYNNARLDYAAFMNVLNNIKQSLNNQNTNMYDSINNQYQMIKTTSNAGFQMDQDVSFILMSVQSYCTDEDNHNYYKNLILRQIDEFTNTWNQFA